MSVLMKPYIFLIYLLTCINCFCDSTTYTLVLPSGGFTLSYGYVGGSTLSQINLKENQQLKDISIQLTAQSPNNPSQVFYYQDASTYGFNPLYLQLVQSPTDKQISSGEAIKVIATTTKTNLIPSSTATTTPPSNATSKSTKATFWNEFDATCTISYNQNQYTLSFNLPSIYVGNNTSQYSSYTVFYYPNLQK
jgi:hypothetical protein